MCALFDGERIVYARQCRPQNEGEIGKQLSPLWKTVHEHMELSASDASLGHTIESRRGFVTLWTRPMT